MRRFWIALTIAFACMAMIFAGLAWSLYRAGTLSVHVREDGPGGDSIHFTIPAAVLNAGLILMPKAAFAAIGDEMDEELCQLWPMITAACDELERCPDFEMVRVEDGDDFVLVTKRGSSLRVIVESDCESVRVTVPLGTVSSFLRRIERPT